MTLQIRPLLFVMLLLTPVHPLAAQAPAPTPAPSPQPLAGPAPRETPSAPVPVQLQIVIARYQGSKRVSALPYAILTSGRPAPGQAAVRLRMNGEVPVLTTTNNQTDDGKAATFSSFNYRQIGTNIDVMAIPSVEGRYGFSVTVADSSVYGAEEVKAAGIALAPGPPVFRSFNVASVVHLRDGETAEFTAATDRLTGEVTKVEVTLTVLK